MHRNVDIRQMSARDSFIVALFEQASEEGLLTIGIAMAEHAGGPTYFEDIRPLFHRVSFLVYLFIGHTISIYSCLYLPHKVRISQPK